MKSFRSIYADLYVKGSYRARYTPRVSRYRRPHVIAWAGPAAFYPNRFYKRDKWYKARIEKPEKLPQLHTIDPDNYLQSLEERSRVNKPSRVNIGFKERLFSVSHRTILDDKDQERLARKQQIRIDLSTIDHSSISILNHFHVFDDLFGANVFFHNTQRMRVSFSDDIVYYGNVIAAEKTKEKPNVQIEALDGFNTVLALNLDGNPYVDGREFLHWMVSNIHDGEISSGCEDIPYLQAVPFKGTGFHRFVFLLLKHDKKLDFSAYKLKSSFLGERTFSFRQFYRDHEMHLTPCFIAFTQTIWDMSVNRCLHKLDSKAPYYKYNYISPLKMTQKEFPNKPQPFDLYLDHFRDPVDMEAEILKKRLSLRVIKENPCLPKYPDINYKDNKKILPAWQHEKLIKQNIGAGRYNALWNNSLD